MNAATSLTGSGFLVGFADEDLIVRVVLLDMFAHQRRLTFGETLMLSSTRVMMRGLRCVWPELSQTHLLVVLCLVRDHRHERRSQLMNREGRIWMGVGSLRMGRLGGRRSWKKGHPQGNSGTRVFRNFATILRNGRNLEPRRQWWSRDLQNFKSY